MSDTLFTRDNLDSCLKELAKEFRKINGSRIPAEIILIGGASVLINYGFREMTNDLSDVVGILLEQQNNGKKIHLDDIKRVADELYGGYDKIPESSRIFIEATYQNLDLEELYKKIREDERQNKDILLEFQDHYPEVLNGDNLADILKAAKARKNATLPPLDAYADHNV